MIKFHLSPSRIVRRPLTRPPETNFLKERFTMPDYRLVQKIKINELFSGKRHLICYACV